MDFIKNALREFKHVVWPTREETKKYFIVVLAVLCAFGMYLFIVWNIFSEILFGLKNMVNPANTDFEVALPEGLNIDSFETIDPSDANAIIPDVTGEAVVDDIPVETIEVNTWTDDIAPNEVEAVEGAEAQ